jgi:hypothetical protein
MGFAHGRAALTMRCRNRTYQAAVLWFAIAAAVLVALPARERAWPPSMVWLAATVPLGLLAEAILTLAYNQGS